MCLSSVVFNRHHTDLIGLDKGSLTENIAISTETFICKIYGVPEVDTCNKTRVKLYCIGCTQDTLPPTSDVSHHAFTLSSKCLELNTLAVCWSSSSDRNEMDASGRSASATVALSVTYPESLQGDHLMWLYDCTKGCLSQRCSCRNIHMEFIERATAGHLATTVVTLMTTRNTFIWVHLPVYMIT